jgi:hypothetical protein
MITASLILLIILTLLAIAVFSLLHIEAYVDEQGGLFSVRWLLSQVKFDTRTQVLDIQVFSVKVFGKKLGAEGRPEKKPKEKKKRRKKQRRKTSLRRLVEQSKAIVQSLAYLLAHLRLEHLELKATVASPDPALTGMLYGFASSLSSPVTALVPDNVSIAIKPDFEAEIPSGQLDGAIHIRVIYIVITAWRVARATFFRRK